MWPTKYASAIPKNLGVGDDFRPYREGDFLTRRPYSVGPRISVCPPRGSELKKARTLLHKSFQLIVFDASYIHSVSVIYMNTELKAVKIPSHD